MQKESGSKASAKAKVTYKSNGYATWSSAEEQKPPSLTSKFLKSWLGFPSAKDKSKRTHPSPGSNRKEKDSLDLERRLGLCYDVSRRSRPDSTEHSQLSASTQLSLSLSKSLSSSGKSSRHRGVQHRRIPSCDLYSSGHSGMKLAVEGALDHQRDANKKKPPKVVIVEPSEY